MLARMITTLSLLAILFAIVSAGCSSQVPAATSQPDLTPIIFGAKDVPWQEMENGWRRKVLFSGELTLVLLDAKGPTSGPIELHSHANDQISYVIEGDLEVQIGDETKQISTGGFFRVPSNAAHGVQVLSPKLLLVDAFTPPREDFRK